MATTARRTPLHTLTIRGERYTAIPMTPTDLAILDIEHLDLPEDRTGMQGLCGWDIYDGAGTHMGRAIGRSTILAAEWFDDVDQDWLLAKWSCRRLERAVHEIVRLRDDITSQRVAACTRRAEQQQRADYAIYLQRHGLVLDEDGDEMYARHASQVVTATFGSAFAS